MLRLVLLIIICLLPAKTWAGDTIALPWEEFKQLYQESVERRLLKQVPAKKKTQVYSLEQGYYSLAISATRARGELVLSGKVLSGKPAPIDLFGKDIVIEKIAEITGGSFVSSPLKKESIIFLPDGPGIFRIKLSFLAKVQEDNRHRFVTFRIPAALQNALQLKIPPKARLIEPPGILDADGIYHFSARSKLDIRFVKKDAPLRAAVTEIDIFSRIRLHKKRSLLTATLLPRHPLPVTLVMTPPKKFRLASSSLPSSSIRKTEKNRLNIHVPASAKIPFQIRFIRPETETVESISFTLPQIQGNTGNENLFVVEEPDDGEIAYTNKTPLIRTSAGRLHPKLVENAGQAPYIMQAPDDDPIELKLVRFQNLRTPAIVLDRISFFTSFEENGNMLSVLVMDLPPDIGARIRLAAIPGAEIWSLKVNGQKKSVYESDDKNWILPLAAGTNSHVELAFLRRTAKLGLSGRLETLMPATGLPSRKLFVGLALPDRVRLRSVEGPLSPLRKGIDDKPVEFIGQPYYFSRTFYQGEALLIAAVYKEPVPSERR